MATKKKVRRLTPNEATAFRLGWMAGMREAHQEIRNHYNSRATFGLGQPWPGTLDEAMREAAVEAPKNAKGGGRG